MSPKFTKIILKLITFGIIPALLFLVGYQQVFPLFKGEFTQQLGSIEVSYVQMAKFIESSWPHFAWQPLWYLGYPMWLVYTPLVPIWEFLTHHAFNWSYSHGYRVLTAFSYCATLVFVYFFSL